MKKMIVLSLFILLCGLGLILLWNSQHKESPAQYNTLTSAGVVNKIQSLNRLQTVVYHIDTVIQSRKEGNWYRLWQDEQKGLFVAHGRVIAGVDLQKLTAENVHIIPDATQGQLVQITLPSAQVFETYLDKIEVYDVQTGLFNILDIDPEMFNQAQTEAKRQILSSACKTEMLNLATENAQKQIHMLFELANVRVDVKTTAINICG